MSETTELQVVLKVPTVRQAMIILGLLRECILPDDAARLKEFIQDKFPGDTLGMPISELRLPARIYNTLIWYSKIRTIGQLINTGATELLKINNIGNFSICEINRTLQERFGIQLRE